MIGLPFNPAERIAQVQRLLIYTKQYWQDHSEVQDAFPNLSAYLDNIEKNLNLLPQHRSHTSEMVLKIRRKEIENNIKVCVNKVKLYVCFKQDIKARRIAFPTSHYHRKSVVYYREFLNQWKVFITNNPDIHAWFLRDSNNNYTVEKLETLIHQLTEIDNGFKQCADTKKQRSGLHVYKNILIYMLRSFGMSEREVERVVSG